jgi:hypothetical protein
MSKGGPHVRLAGLIEKPARQRRYRSDGKEVLRIEQPVLFTNPSTSWAGAMSQRGRKVASLDREGEGMEVARTGGIHNGTRLAIWIARIAIAAVGLVVSFLMANNAARVVLSWLPRAGEAFSLLSPFCACGGLLEGWSTEAGLAGVRRQTRRGFARWAQGLLLGAHGFLWGVSSAGLLLLRHERMPEHTRILVPLLTACVLAAGIGFVSGFESAPKLSLPVKDDA